MKNHLTIGRRITIAVSSLCLLIVLVGVIILASLREVNYAAHIIRVDTMPSLIQSGTFTSAAGDGMVCALLYGSPETTSQQRTSYRKQLAGIGNDMDQAMTNYVGAIMGETDRVFAAG